MKWMLLVLLSGGLVAMVASRQVATTQSSSGPAAADPARHGIHIAGTGYVEPATEVRRLEFRANGIIAQNHVEVGSKVVRGQVLMSLDDHVLLGELETARTNLKLAEARRSKTLSGIHSEAIRAAVKRVAAWNIKRQYWQRELERGMKLRDGKTITEAELDEKRMRCAAAGAEVTAAEAQLAELQTHVREEDRVLADAEVANATAQLELICERIKDSKLTAQCDGTILEVLKREGEAVSEAIHDPVVLLADCSQLRVRAEFDERHVPDLQVGLPVRIYGRNLGSRSINGTIAHIKQVMGEKTVFTRAASERHDLDVVEVFVDLPKGETIPIGLRVDVMIEKE